MSFTVKRIEGDFLEFLLSERLPGYLLFPIVLSGLPTVARPLEASDKSCLMKNTRCVKIIVLRKSELFQSI